MSIIPTEDETTSYQTSEDVVIRRGIRQAIQQSIQHWRENQSVTDIRNAKLGGDYCALCLMFKESDCYATTYGICPAALKTGKFNCSGTPYWDVIDLRRRMFDRKLFLADDGWRAACQKEIEFLESLLPAYDDPKEVATEPSIIPQDSGYNPEFVIVYSAIAALFWAIVYLLWALYSRT